MATTPSDDQTLSPTQIPSVNPISPTLYPTTLTPTYAVNSDGYQMIDTEDIDFEVIESVSSHSSNYFNPGFKNKLVSSVEIFLDTEYKLALFETWVNSQAITMNVTVDWSIYDTTDPDNKTLVSVSDVDVSVVSYNDQFLDVDNSVYTIDSYYVIYSDTTSNAKYSGLPSLCNTFDETYFESGNTYKFVNSIYVVWIDTTNNQTYNISKSESIELIANSIPYGGSCSVTPDNGTVLLDFFNFSCSGWEDDDSESQLEYNFILDESNTFLNRYYSNTTTWAQTRLPSRGAHNVTAIIIDENNLATCVSIQAYANYDNINDRIESVSIDNFTQWLSNTFQTIINDSSSDNDNDVWLTLQAAYGVETDYIEINSWQSDEVANSSLISLQQEILDVAISQTYKTNTRTESGALIALATMSTITSPLVNVEDLNDDSNSNYNYVYDADVISGVFTAMSENVISTLETETTETSMGSDTGQEIFDVFSNLQEMRRITNESIDTAKHNGQIVINSTKIVVSLLLNDSVPGESYMITTDTMNVKAAKISMDRYDECSEIETESSLEFDLPPELMKIQSNNGKNYMDCSVMLSIDNLYGIYQNYSKTNTWQSEFVMIDVSGTSDDDQANNRRARRMQDTSDDSSIWLSSCQPVIIKYNVTNVTFFDDNNTNFPQCSFYNETKKDFEDNGCYVVSHDRYTVYCACLHLTNFGLTYQDFTPEINFISSNFYASISWENLMKYPLGWIFCLSWLALCCLLFFLLNKVEHTTEIEDMPLLVK